MKFEIEYDSKFVLENKIMKNNQIVGKTLVLKLLLDDSPSISRVETELNEI